MRYNTDQVFSAYFRNRIILKEEQEEVMKAARDFVEWVRPDYYFIGGPNVPGLILFEKNYNLDFAGNKPCSLSVMENILEDQVMALQEIDSLTLKYAMSNPMKARDFVFKLNFNVRFRPNDVRTLERKIVILKVNEEGQPDLAILSISDVTKLNPEQKIGFEIRVNHDLEESQDLSWTDELSTKVEEIINPKKLSLTKREIQILRQIEMGLSSNQIAEKLFISKCTVDTHRQNMIKKFNVPNTTSLIFVAKQKGLL